MKNPLNVDVDVVLSLLGDMQRSVVKNAMAGESTEYVTVKTSDIQYLFGVLEKIEQGALNEA